MTRTIIYKYLGTNGIIESPVHLEDIYYVTYIELTADKGKVLTDGKKRVKSVRVSSDQDASLWKEAKA